jgi:uncharacterized protein
MKSIIERWRQDATVAHVGPLAAFMVLIMLLSLGKVDYAGAPWWRAAPEHWFYPVQIVLVGALLFFWKKHYTFRPFSLRAGLIGAAAGVIGIAFWILPQWLHAHYGWQVKWLGIADRSGPGFDPTLFGSGTTGYYLTAAARLLRMTVLVPFVEELFWRGYLWRQMASEGEPWTSVPSGVRSLRAWAVTSVAMVFVHQPIDYVPCLIWSALAGGVLYWTRSLGACVVCHAVSNLVLGLYVLRTEQWGFW